MKKKKSWLIYTNERNTQDYARMRSEGWDGEDKGGGAGTGGGGEGAKYQGKMPNQTRSEGQKVRLCLANTGEDAQHWTARLYVTSCLLFPPIAFFLLFLSLSLFFFFIRSHTELLFSPSLASFFPAFPSSCIWLPTELPHYKLFPSIPSYRLLPGASSWWSRNQPDSNLTPLSSWLLFPAVSSSYILSHVELQD